MKFEDLEAWQMARVVVNAIYQLTRQPLIRHDFGLCSQIQRAAVSVMSNIAEGFERGHLREKIHLYKIARGSAGEVRSLLYVVEDNYPDQAPEAKQLRGKVVPIGKKVSGLIRSTESRTQ